MTADELQKDPEFKNAINYMGLMFMDLTKRYCNIVDLLKNDDEKERVYAAFFKPVSDYRNKIEEMIESKLNAN